MGFTTPEELELIAEARYHIDRRRWRQEGFDGVPWALGIRGEGPECFVLRIQEVVDPEVPCQLLPPCAEPSSQDEVVLEGLLLVGFVAAEKLGTDEGGAERQGEPVSRV